MKGLFFRVPVAMHIEPQPIPSFITTQLSVFSLPRSRHEKRQAIYSPQPRKLAHPSVICLPYIPCPVVVACGNWTRRHGYSTFTIPTASFFVCSLAIRTTQSKLIRGTALLLWSPSRFAWEAWAVMTHIAVTVVCHSSQMHLTLSLALGTVTSTTPSFFTSAQNRPSNIVVV